MSTFTDTIAEFETWVLDPIDVILNDPHYVQAVILSMCAIDFLAQADKGRSLSMLKTNLTAYSTSVGYGGGPSNSAFYEAFCRCFLGDYGATEMRAATMYRTVRCGLVHAFTTAPSAISAKPVVPLDVVLTRDKVSPVELGVPAAALLVSVPGLVAAVRTAIKKWSAVAIPAAQTDFVSAWHIREVTASSSTFTTPATASLGTLTAPGVSQDLASQLIRITKPQRVNRDHESASAEP
jgi:hypothetical protein